mgnify:CR=1 FL=1
MMGDHHLPAGSPGSSFVATGLGVGDPLSNLSLTIYCLPRSQATSCSRIRLTMAIAAA